MTTQEFIFDTPLYQWVSQDEESERIVADLRWVVSGNSKQLTIEGFNAQKQVDSTYTICQSLSTRHNLHHDPFSSLDVPFQEDNIWHVSMECGRYGDKIDLVLFLQAEDHSIMKVGQYPSVADMHIGKIKQYKSVLSKEDLKEFTRAIGLAANGIGIGSFVYLRRIFEKLIDESANEAIRDGRITKDEFVKLRMDEKISSIRDYLPETLVELKSLYGILSKGIHELSEQECLAYFDAMRVGIELILDEELEKKRRCEKKQLAVSAISGIKSKIR